ncbi:hypothetical protein BOTBODRAFT_637854 [Botryobasidium botryosum FD-172 SS1]|uniref:Uncharacterized protein n=1 Tax=Botryobasidium botryosum (strain FD-172 SS1) TaxID=930990 RepID=A0A067M928_BOTB1|nr:hypothetical protein BOTBODRAFT_637854 [Botryobasidium botryosum FD-172 SS1]
MSGGEIYAHGAGVSGEEEDSNRRPARRWWGRTRKGGIKFVFSAIFLFLPPSLPKHVPACHTRHLPISVPTLFAGKRCPYSGISAPFFRFRSNPCLFFFFVFAISACAGAGDASGSGCPPLDRCLRDVLIAALHGNPQPKNAASLRARAPLLLECGATKMLAEF